MSIAESELLYPETAVAIAVLETGGFRSKKLMKSYNWFGFRANARGFQRGVKNGYGYYATPEAMLMDYKTWESQICQKYKLYSENQFRVWINGHYAEDPAYSSKLASTLKLIASTWN